MKKLALFCCFAMLPALLAAQKIVGDDVSDFRAVSLSGKFTAEFVHGDKPGLTIEGANLEVTRVEWGVTNGVLSVKLKPGSKVNENIRVTVVYQELETIKLNGGDAFIRDTLSAMMFDLELQGASKFSGTVDCSDISIVASGNSAATVSGKVRFLTVRATMKSKIELASLSAMSVYAVSNTGAEVWVDPRERLVAETNTGSSVYYKGLPAIVRFSTKLGGSVISIDGQGVGKSK